MNLKNSLKQLADPFYLWKKSKLDCVSAWGAGRHHWPGQDEQDRPQKIFCGVFLGYESLAGGGFGSLGEMVLPVLPS